MLTGRRHWYADPCGGLSRKAGKSINILEYMTKFVQFRFQRRIFLMPAQQISQGQDGDIGWTDTGGRDGPDRGIEEYAGPEDLAADHGLDLDFVVAVAEKNLHLAGVDEKQ